MSTTSGRAMSRVELVPPPLPSTTNSSIAHRQSSLHSIMQTVNMKTNSVYNDHPDRDSLNEGVEEGGGGGGGVEGGGVNCPLGGNRVISTPGSSPTRDHEDSPSAANLGELGPCGRRHRRNLLGILTNSGHSHRKKNMGLQEPHLMHHHKRNSSEPYTYVWISLSSLYGRLVVILMLAFCLVEVMDNHVKLLTLQGVFLMYLYVGSIAVIMCIYIWVLIDSCASLQSSDGSQPPTLTTSIVADAELAGGLPHGGDPPSMSRFGSLKRAHISRSRTAYTSFYLRLGALAFGLGTLVFNGLEMAMHSMMEGSCLNDVVFVHPVLHGLFTFLQMHFLFVNSQVLVERFGVAARFGFMHLAATNLALWIRLVIWESGNEWTYFVYLAQTGLQGTPNSVHGPSAALAREIPTPLQLRGFPRSMTMARAARDITFGVNLSAPARVYMPVSDNHIGQVVALHECLNTNSLGQLWTSSMPFLYPFIVQFSLIAAAVTFVMGQNVGRSISLSGISRSLSIGKSTTSTSSSSFTVDCTGASKGLFLGLLCLVAGIVVIIIFLVVKEDEDIPSDTIFWLTFGALGSVLAICLIMTLIGLVQVRLLSIIGRRPTPLDRLLSGITLSGVVLYSVFGLVVGASGVWRGGSGAQRHAMLLCVSVLQLLQAAAQSALVGEASRRAALTRHQQLTRPSRQVVTFLLFANAVLWAYDTFVVQSWVSQEMQLRFFGVLAWGVISRVGLPLLVFYRFHSCVLLLEVWKCSYRTGLSGN